MSLLSLTAEVAEPLASIQRDPHWWVNPFAAFVGGSIPGVIAVALWFAERRRQSLSAANAASKERDAFLATLGYSQRRIGQRCRDFGRQLETELIRFGASPNSDLPIVAAALESVLARYRIDIPEIMQISGIHVKFLEQPELADLETKLALLSELRFDQFALTTRLANPSTVSDLLAHGEALQEALVKAADGIHKE
ncbi:hypothetical protein ACQKH5_05085 [Hyphomonas sp. NPDC076900]|uniref:hypothetical protein n=1 Tax=unclassified Hyphomonas TaxID=2630699 RepID=UPI003D0055CE